MLRRPTVGPHQNGNVWWNPSKYQSFYDPIQQTKLVEPTIFIFSSSVHYEGHPSSIYSLVSSFTACIHPQYPSVGTLPSFTSFPRLDERLMIAEIIEVGDGMLGKNGENYTVHGVDHKRQSSQLTFADFQDVENVKPGCSGLEEFSGARKRSFGEVLDVADEC